MRKTYAVVELDLIDITAKTDSNIVADSFMANIESLRSDDLLQPNYGTLEMNNFVLDGSKKQFPDEEIGGYISPASDYACGFSTNPQIDISFSTNHSSAGLTFYFWGNYPKKLKITYYRGSYKLSSFDITVTSFVFFAESKAENYNRIVIEFTKTWDPYERIKMYRIDYGTYFKWDKSNVMNAKITEEVDPISSQLSINKVDVKIYDKSTDFNVLNPKGLYKFLQTAQEFRFTEFINDSPVNMGTFYLDKSESDKETQISFSCVDALGILDKTTFVNGRVYNGDLAEVVIGEIMASAGWEKYTIEEELKGKPIYGYIRVCTHREALQQVVFSIGAVADCSRTDDIKIYSVKKSVNSYINKNRKLSGKSKEELKDFVSDIELTIHNYVLQNEETEIFSGFLDSGVVKITFDSPYSGVSSTAEVLETGTNFVVLNVDAPGEYSVSGYLYEDMSSVMTTSLEQIPANQSRQVVQITDATLVTTNNAKEISKKLLDYYSLRNKTEAKIILENEKTGNWTSITGLFNQKYAGCIESQTIDLTGGFLSTIKLVGFDKELVAYYYTGELYSGSETGVM